MIFNHKKTENPTLKASTGFENLKDIIEYLRETKTRFTMKLDNHGEWKINVGRVQPDIIVKETLPKITNEEEQPEEQQEE